MIIKLLNNTLLLLSRKLKKAGVEISGLQFYLANYPDATTFKDGTRVTHPRKNSFYIVPTLKYEGKDYGFFTAESEDGKRHAVLINDRDKAVSGRLQKSDKQNEKKYLTNEIEKSYSGFNFISFGNIPCLSPASSFNREQSLVMNESNLIPPPHQDDFN